MTKKKMNIPEVIGFINSCGPSTKVYLGADSERYKSRGKWMVDYITVVAVHIDGRRGCKVFGEVTTEVDFDRRKDRPAHRLMTEVRKVSDLYFKIEDALYDKEFEIHLDINPDEKFGSSCVVKEAIGYIRGTCNVIPMVKPHSFAASFCADRFKEAIQK